MSKDIILTFKCIWCGKEIDIKEGEPTPYCSCMFVKKQSDIKENKNDSRANEEENTRT